MKITAVQATWVHVPIPYERQHVSDFLEYSLGANPLLHELVHEKFPVVDGQLEIPDRPGLGITVDEDFVRHHARD